MRIPRCPNIYHRRIRRYQPCKWRYISRSKRLISLRMGPNSRKDPALLLGHIHRVHSRIAAPACCINSRKTQRLGRRSSRNCKFRNQIENRRTSKADKFQEKLRIRRQNSITKVPAILTHYGKISRRIQKWPFKRPQAWAQSRTSWAIEACKQD